MKKVFLFLVSIYIVSRLVRDYVFYLPLWHDYVHDFLCLPIVLHSTQWLMDKILPIPRKISWAEVSFTILAFSVVFEYYLPLKSAIYVADWGDVLAYLLGGVFYQWMVKPDFGEIEPNLQ